MRSRSLRSESECSGAAGPRDEGPGARGEGAGGQGAGGPKNKQKKRFKSWSSRRRRSENLTPLSPLEERLTYG